MRFLLVLAVLVASCKAQPPAPAAPSAPRPASTTTPSGIPVKEITANEKGFVPARIDVEGGKLLILRFTRTTKDTCADAVDIEGDPVRHMLPLKIPVDIKLTPPASGQLTFACPMRMYRGVLVVTPK